MAKSIEKLIDSEEIHYFKMLMYELWYKKKNYLLNNEILLAFKEFCEEHGFDCINRENASILKLLKQTTSIIIAEEFVILVHRYQQCRYRVYRVSIHQQNIEEISIPELLDYRDRYVFPEWNDKQEKLSIDFMPFYDYSPNIRDIKSVGRGVDFLNKHMSSNLFQNPEKWSLVLYNFLQIHSFDGIQLLINGKVIPDYSSLIDHLEECLNEINEFGNSTAHTEIDPILKKYGFEPGWGNSVGRIRETMLILLELLQSPDAQNLENFISRIPMISKIVIVSPHGWFGQEHVLGRPDTGGQVVYILDQVKALEKSLMEQLTSYGLSIKPKILILTRLIENSDITTCNTRLEKVHDTINSYILRIPFIDEHNNTVPHWISRFKIWPYLERFAHEARVELISELNGRPDLVIGNYSDGNIVATLLASHFDVTQCNIAHALEKNKYLFSDLYWKNYEDEYSFSLQFTADLIAMNMADFIITSTYQEIKGSQYIPGQYETYQFFTMPGLMQVENGLNLFHPKFNVIPPGVDENYYFPFYEKERRLENQKSHLTRILFEEENDDATGIFEDKNKPVIFTMSRMDKNKNISGLVESFGKSARLQELCNLLIVAGKIDPEHATDDEEREEIILVKKLIDKYKLNGKIRWLGIHFSKDDSGEIYRIIADGKGVFVQPGLYESFGLTVLEAMQSGVPTFATHFGGPSEIINHRECGFLINPTRPELISEPLLYFFDELEKKPSYWDEISQAGIKRVQENFTWKLYCDKLLKLTSLYGFWRYSVSQAAKKDMKLYCHVLYHLMLKPRARYLEHKDD